MAGRRKYPWLLAIVAGALVAACSAGSSNDGGSTDGTDATLPPVVASPSTSAPALVNPAQVGATEYTFSYIEDSGVKVYGYLWLAPIAPANDSDFVSDWRKIVASAPDEPCVDDPTRDGVYRGSIAFKNLTPDFHPKDLAFSLDLPEEDLGARFPVHTHYGNLDSCGTEGNIEPNMTGAQWGPVPLEVDVPNAYGPNGLDDSLSLDGYNIVLFVLGYPRDVQLLAGDNMIEVDNSEGTELAFRMP